MAITHIEYTLFSALQGQFPSRPHVLELGRNNWYGDVPLTTLGNDLYQHHPERDRCRPLIHEIDRLGRDLDEGGLYRLAAIFFEIFTGCASLSSIDPGVSGSTWQFDLNEPVSLQQTFDVVLNLGTADHVFNVHQFFKTAHELTSPRGLMIHGSPLTGWMDNGFYSFHPTFFCDLAEANRYELPILLYAELTPPKVVQLQNRDHALQMFRSGQVAQNSLIYAVFRQPVVKEAFRSPIQSCYRTVPGFEKLCA